VGAQQAERLRAIESALLDFQRAPGRYKLALREPATLFASVREVLQLAAGRDDTQARADVSHAARFFVRTAMLQPGADHYTLFGLPRHADSAAIKDRYRALIRVVHPDFATSTGADWPSDTATRINQAYEVLSSAERRRAYDESQAPAPKPPPAPVKREAAPAKTPSPPRRNLGEPRRVLRRLAAGFGALGAIALAGLWAATAQNDRDLLVQRASTRVAAGELPRPVGTPEVAQPPADPAPMESQAGKPEPMLVAASAPAAASAATAPTLPVVLASTTPALLAAPAAATAAPAIQVVQAAPADRPANESARPSAPQPAASPAAPPATASPLNMATVQPLLTRLLQDIESGWGDTLMAGLGRDLRRTPGAQALARQLDTLCDGVRPVKIARVDFRGEPRDGTFVVSGQVVLDVRDSLAPTRQLALQAEFSERDGAPVLTRLGQP
jgi:DnaJ-domain-containing protein 1